MNLDPLYAQGTVVRRAAQFELDREEARRKMQRFRLADPRHYILEWVQAAHLLGATRILISQRAREISLRFDAEPLTPEDLLDLYAAAFAPRSTPREHALRHIALGLGAAQGLEFSLVLIESGGQRLSIRPDKKDHLTAIPAHRDTLLLLRERATLAHPLRLLQAVQQTSPEASLLRTRCYFSELLITLDGERVSHGKRPGSSFPVSVPIKEPSAHGVLALRPGTGRSVCSILQHGVLILEHVFTHPSYCVRAIVDASRLTRDLSQGAFVEDAQLEWFRDEILTQHTHRALRRLLEPLLQGDRLRSARQVGKELLEELPHLAQMSAQWMVEVARSVFRDCGDIRERQRPIPPHTRALALLLERLPMWPVGHAVTGCEPWESTLVSMRDLGVGLDAPGQLRVTRERISQLDFAPGQHILWQRTYDHDDPQHILTRYLQTRPKDLTQSLLDQRTRKHNMATWRATAPYHPGDEQRWLEPLHLDVLGQRIEVCIWQGHKPSEWLVIKQGRLFFGRRLQGFSLPNVRICWRGDLPATYLFDDVERSAMVGAMALHTFELLARVALKLAHRVSKLSIERQHAPWLIGFLDGLLSGDLLKTLFAALGLSEPVHTEALRGWQAHSARSSQRLFWLPQLARRQARTPAEVAATQAALGELAHARLFDSLAGFPVSFDELMQTLDTHGWLPVIPPEDLHDAQRHWRRARATLTASGSPLPHIVLITPVTERILRALLSPRQLRIFSHELARAAARSKFLGRAPEPLQLRRGALFELPLQGDTYRGVIGLFSHSPGPPGKLSICLMHEQRTVLTTTRLAAIGQLEAVVDARALTLTPDGEGVREDEAFVELVERVERAVWEVLSQWLLAMRALMCARDNLLPAQLLDLTCHPLLLTGSGEWLTLQAFDEQLRCHHDLYYCAHPLPGDFLEQLGELRPRDVIVIPERLARPHEVLAELFPGKYRVLNVRELRTLKLLARNAHADFIKRECVALSLEGEPVHQLRLTESHMRSVIGLMPDDAPHIAAGAASITYLHQSRVVATLPLTLPLGRVVASVDSDELIDWSLGDAMIVAVRYELEQLIERALSTLLLQVCERVALTPHSAAPGTLRMLRAYFWRLNHRAPLALRPVRAALEETPLYPRADGQWVSALEISASPTPWQVSVAAGQGRAPSRPEHTLTLHSYDELELLRRTLPEQRFEPVALPEEQRSPPVQEEAAARSEPSELLQGKTLIARLRHMLLLAEPKHRTWFEGALLSGLRIEAIATDERVVSAASDLVLISAEHRAVRHAMAHPGDAFALGLLASSVYSAMNLFWEAISDSDERCFHAALAAHLLHQDNAGPA